MLNNALKLVGLLVLLAGTGVGVWVYHDSRSSARKIEQLEQEQRVLTKVVQRLSDEKRVAEVLVTDRQTIDGVLHTELLFVEYDKAGNSLPPRTFTIKGNLAHIDALVIKFDRDFIKQGDGLRGHSIALFTRLYGDSQQPDEAFRIDEPGQIPAVYRGADARVTEFEMKLWQNFWKLADDAAYRAEHGVRVANGQGVWGPFEPDKLYTITLESDGGLNVTSEPLRGIYREALKRRQITDAKQ